MDEQFRRAAYSERLGKWVALYEENFTISNTGHFTCWSIREYADVDAALEGLNYKVLACVYSEEPAWTCYEALTD